MAEKPFTGLTASVKIKEGSGSTATSTTIAYLSGVSLEVSTDIIEILSFGATFKEKVPSIRDWAASCDGTVAFEDGGSQEKLIDAFDNGTAITLGIYLNESTYFEGDAYVESYSIDAAPDDAVTLSAEFSGSGAVTHTFGTNSSTGG